MGWVQFAIFFGSTLGLFIGNRSALRSDMRHMGNKLDAIQELSREIHLELKDFHYRLLEIEKSRKY